MWCECYNIETTTELRFGIVDNNYLTGEIPPEIGNLTNLLFISLNSHQLTGSIPPEIGNLTNLLELEINAFLSDYEVYLIFKIKVRMSK